jgi:hypothetical protein
MSYKVLNDFKEKSHDNTVYRKGEDYPKEGFNVDPDRISFLQNIHSAYGISFLEVPVEAEIENSIDSKKATKRTLKSGDK